MVTINSSSLPSRVTPGNPSQATVTIVDNDGKHMHGQTSVSLYVHRRTYVKHACIQSPFIHINKTFCIYM